MKKTLVALIPLFIIVVAGFFISKKPMNNPILPADHSGESPSSNSATPSTSATSTAATIPAEKQTEVLESILKSGNDNDPRLDSDLKVLSEPAKQSFGKKYESIPAEKRNEKGTIVFLLGRNLQTENDIVFMGKVLREEPCRGLKNCREDMLQGDAHSESGIEVTLAYPQIMALKALERILSQGRTHPLFTRSMEEVKAATNSPVDIIAKMAKDLEKKYGR